MTVKENRGQSTCVGGQKRLLWEGIILKHIFGCCVENDLQKGGNEPGRKLYSWPDGRTLLLLFFLGVIHSVNFFSVPCDVPFMKCKHSCVCRHPVVLAPFVEQSFFTIELSWHPCWKSVDHKYLCLFLDSIFIPPIYPSILMLVPHCLNTVALSGGVFTNRLLFSKSVSLLEENGFMVYYNRIYPTNDGCISSGQIYLRSLKV